jgi:tetratricopeptide (TPR) repeat protein
VENLLDLYTGRWVAMHREACEATQIKREQSEALMDLRMACLDKRLLELRGLVKVLADADRDVVARAVVAASSLTPIERCADTKALRSAVPPPDDPQVERQVEAIRGRMAEGQAMYAAGRYLGGLELAKGLVHEAKALEYEPLLAEALLLQGKLQARAAHIDEGIEAIKEAGFLAEANRADELVADAQTLLVFVIGQQAARHEEGLAWAEHAKAAVARAGGLGKLPEATLISYLGMVHGSLGDYESALRYARRSVELEEELLGPDDPRRASGLNSLGVTLLWTEDIDGAREAFERCLEVEERANGPRNPRVGHVLNNIGVLYMDSNDHEAAKPVLERALKIVEESLGPEHPAVASPLNNLGRILTDEGKWEPAAENIERALAIWEKALGPEHPTVAEAYDNLAYLHSKREQHAEALSSARRALEIRQKAYGEDDVNTAGSLGRVAEALLAVGRRKEALDAAERSHDLAAGEPGTTTRLPHAEFLLARILWGASRDEARARSLASKARDGYARLGRTADAREIEKWLEVR